MKQTPSYYILIISVFICFNLTFYHCNEIEHKKKKVLFLGVDGLSHYALNKLIQEDQLPNFKKLQISLANSGGIYGTPQQNPTVSGPNWATILTGTYMNRHKVGGNRFFEMKIAKEVPTIFQHIKQGNPDLKMHYIVGWDNLYDLVAQFDGELLEKKILNDLDEKIFQYAKQSLEQEDPDFLFIAFDGVDATGHSRGYGSAYDNDVMVKNSYLGAIMKIIEERDIKFNEDWLIISASDHGRESKGIDHGYLPESYSSKSAYIASNKPLNEEFDSQIQPPLDNFNNINKYPSLASIAPTILKYLGVQENDQEQKIDGIPLIGNQGLSKLMLKGDILAWGIYRVGDSEKKCIKKSDKYVKIYDNLGNIIEQVEFCQGKWPQSKEGQKAWDNNTEFRFSNNGVNVWFNKLHFQRSNFQIYTHYMRYYYGLDEIYQKIIDYSLYGILIVIVYTVWKIGYPKLKKKIKVICLNRKKSSDDLLKNNDIDSESIASQEDNL